MFLAALFKLAENWKQSIRRRQWHPTPVLLPGTSSEIDGKTMETVADFIFWGAPKSWQMVTAAIKLKDAYSLEEKL